MINYALRPATQADLELLDRIHTENMKGYVEQLYSWNSNLFIDNFIAAQYQVIEVDCVIAGFLKVVVSQSDIYLGEIQIAARDRSKGIGSSIISNLIRRARQDDRRLWLKVIKNNPAVELYRRLGFTVFATSRTHLMLEIKPQP